MMKETQEQLSAMSKSIISLYFFKFLCSFSKEVKKIEIYFWRANVMSFRVEKTKKKRNTYCVLTDLIEFLTFQRTANWWHIQQEQSTEKIQNIFFVYTIELKIWFFSDFAFLWRIPRTWQTEPIFFWDHEKFGNESK